MALGGLLGGSTGVMSITTTLGADKLLVLRMSGSERLSRLPEYRVDLVGNTTLTGSRESIDIHALLGTRANVTIDVRGTPRHFNAFITQAQRGERHGRFDSFSIVMRPWLWFATRTRNSRVFQNKTVKDIVTDVLATYSADSDWRLLSESAYPTLEYCLQYDETDFDFVSRLLEEHGIYYFFEHSDTAHTLVLVDAMVKHVSKEDSSPVVWANQLKEEGCITNWRCVEEARSLKVAVADYDYLDSANVVTGEHAVPPVVAHEVLGDAEIYEYPARVVQNQTVTEAVSAGSDAYHRAKLILQEAQSLQTCYTGTTNAFDMAVGTTFQLSKSARTADNVNYLLVGCTFRAEYADHEAIEDLKSIKQRRDGFVAEVVAINAMEAVFRPERSTPKPRMWGPQTAVVVGASGNEIETDKHGRVKVQFPWDREGENNENSSCWVRVSQPWAGKKMGLWMLPRIGHEVVVSFIDGDPDRPLVTGSLHNDLNTPPYDLPTQAHTSGWVSHSTKEGAADALNELRFCDDKDNEHIWFQAQKAFYRHVKGDTFDHLEMNETRKVVKAVKEVVGEEWSLNVGKDVMHDFGKDFHTTVAGDIFTKGAATWQIKLAKELSVKTDTDVSVDATGKTDWKSGGDIHTESGGVIHLKSTGNLVGESNGKISFKAAAGDFIAEALSIKQKASTEFVIECPAGIKLVCGGSSIALTPAGVTIDGTLVSINGGGGGGSAGSGESAAAASPKEVADAKVLEDLKPDKASDYDKLLADPFATEAAAATPAVPAAPDTSAAEAAADAAAEAAAATAAKAAKTAAGAADAASAAADEALGLAAVLANTAAAAALAAGAAAVAAADMLTPSDSGQDPAAPTE